MKRNENKEFQSQVIFSPKLSLSLSQRHFRNLAWTWASSPLDPKCRMSNVSTSIDGTCVHRSILIFICRGISWCRSTALDVHRSIVLPLIDLYMVSSDEIYYRLGVTALGMSEVPVDRWEVCCDDQHLTHSVDRWLGQPIDRFYHRKGRDRSTMKVWYRSTVGCEYRSTTKLLRRAMWNVDLYGWCVPNEQDRLRTASLSPCCFWYRWACTRKEKKKIINENKEFQSQVKNSSGHFRNLAWTWASSPLDPKCRMSNVSTLIDGTCVHRSILIFICRGMSWCGSTALDAHRSIVLPLVDLYMVSSDEMSFKLQNASKS
ncbi:hypothetical protein IGI04_036364 [Brassica rapa subsp. trilocularis]|uniref:Uncharacterized protein n=1 Tax=Brassica rapa subsp. trilocularis TaxID=1813537 RepID=A0ABQ7LEC8_BRACM|nr:hypothetical protein IGI04_036364 [Brassica rapa subsp. trilocularis]